MKKYLSVFYLVSRHSFYKIIAVMAISGFAQYFFFNKELSALAHYDTSSVAAYPDLERLISLSAVNVIFALTVAAVLFSLSICGTAFGSRCNYTIKRLSVNESTYFKIQTVYNCIILIVLLGAEILLAYIFSMKYISAAKPSFISDQSVFLAFYRNEFLHSLLPLSDILIWIRNIMQIFALSLSAAFFSYKQRRSKRSIGVIFLTVFSIIWNSGEVGGSLSVIVTYLICGSVIAFIIAYVKNGWGENNEYNY